MASWLQRAYWSTFTLWHTGYERHLPYQPLSKILSLQNRRLQCMVAHAYKTVPYYREIMDQAGMRPEDFRAADDLASLPLLTREQVAREPERFVSNRHKRERGIYLDSSGTSGHIRRVYYDRTALLLSLVQGHRQRLVLSSFVGKTFGYREAVVVISTSISPELRRFYESYTWTPQVLDLSRAVITFDNSSLADIVAQLNAFQPDVILGYGSFLGAVYRWASEQEVPIVRPKAIVYGADHMAEADRQLIETVYGIPVLSNYQAVEALRIAFQCEQRAGFHVSLDAVSVRVVDDSGATLGPGKVGHLVLSNLTNRATVLLNYMLGDMVKWSPSVCSCGRTLPTLEGIDGRSDDWIMLPDGRRLHAMTVLEPFDKGIPGLIQVQLIQESLHSFLLRVVCTRETAWEPMRQRLEAALRPLLKRHSSFIIERVETIPPGPGGKVRAVISYCQP